MPARDGCRDWYARSTGSGAAPRSSRGPRRKLAPGRQSGYRVARDLQAARMRGFRGRIGRLSTRSGLSVPRRDRRCKKSRPLVGRRYPNPMIHDRPRLRGHHGRLYGRQSRHPAGAPGNGGCQRGNTHRARHLTSLLRRRKRPSVLVGHSTKEYIPFQQSDALVSRLRKSGIEVTYVTPHGTRHATAMLDDKISARIMTFLHATLGA